MPPKTKSKVSTANRSKKTLSLTIPDSDDGFLDSVQENVDPSAITLASRAPCPDILEWSRQNKEMFSRVHLETSVASEMMLWIAECKSALAKVGKNQRINDFPIIPPPASARKRTLPISSSKRFSAQKRLRHSIKSPVASRFRHALNVSAAKSKLTPEEEHVKTPQAVNTRPRRAAAENARKKINANQSTVKTNNRRKKVTAEASSIQVTTVEVDLSHAEDAPAESSKPHMEMKKVAANLSATEIALVVQDPEPVSVSTPPPKRIRGSGATKPKSKESVFFQDRTRLSPVQADETMGPGAGPSDGPVTSTPVLDQSIRQNLRQAQANENPVPPIWCYSNDGQEKNSPRSSAGTDGFMTAVSHPGPTAVGSAERTVIQSKTDTSTSLTEFITAMSNNGAKDSGNLEKSSYIDKTVVTKSEKVSNTIMEVGQVDASIHYILQRSQLPFNAQPEKSIESEKAKAVTVNRHSVVIPTAVEEHASIQLGPSTSAGVSWGHMGFNISCTMTVEKTRNAVQQSAEKVLEVVVEPQKLPSAVSGDSEWESEDEVRETLPKTSPICPPSKAIRPKKFSRVKKKSLKMQMISNTPVVRPKGAVEPEKRQPSFVRSPSKSPTRDRTESNASALKAQDAARRRDENLRQKQEEQKRKNEDRLKKAREKREAEEKEGELKKMQEIAKRNEQAVKHREEAEARKKEAAEKHNQKLHLINVRRAEKEEELKRQARARLNYSPEEKAGWTRPPTSTKSDIMPLKAGGSAIKTSRSDEGVPRTPMKDTSSSSSQQFPCKPGTGMSGLKKPPIPKLPEKSKMQSSNQSDAKGAVLTKKPALEKSITASKMIAPLTLEELRSKDREAAIKDKNKSPVIEHGQSIVKELMREVEKVDVTSISIGGKQESPSLSANQSSNGTFTIKPSLIGVTKVDGKIPSKPLILNTPIHVSTSLVEKTPGTKKATLLPEIEGAAVKAPLVAKVTTPFAPPSHVRVDAFGSSSLISKHVSKTAVDVGRMQDQSSSSGSVAYAVVQSLMSLSTGSKPKLDIKHVASAPELEDYGLDIAQDDDTDDEERPRKEVPKWAHSSRLLPSIREQLSTEWDLDDIFAGVRPTEKVDLTTIFRKKAEHYQRRTSSQVWPHGIENLGKYTPLHSTKRPTQDEFF